MTGKIRWERWGIQSPPYPWPGKARKVPVLMEEPKKEKPTAHQGTERPPRKKASVLFWRRANQPPMKTISTR